MSAKQSPYGSWKSPIDSNLIVSNMVRIGKVCLDGDDAYWLETRPEEAGRDMVCSAGKGRLCDITPQPFNTRTRVHEFGGGGFTAAGGMVFFSNLLDQRVYVQKRHNSQQFDSPIPLTPEPSAPGRHLRFADLALDINRNRLIAVQEDHRETDDNSPAAIVSIPIDGDPAQAPQVLLSGSDFYTSPRVSPDGSKLAWLQWNHPDMPWYQTELWIADIASDGTLKCQKRIESAQNDAITQPEWSPDGLLYFCSDRSGWWNIYRLKDEQTERIMDAPVECGVPHIYFGNTSYGFASKDRIICAFAEKGVWSIAELDIGSGKLARIDSNFQEITFLKVNEKRAIFRGGSPSEPVSIVELDLATREFNVLKRSFELDGQLAKDLPRYLSKPERVEFPSSNGRIAHAFYYPPSNADFAAPEQERPPLIVKIHGGPNNQAFNTLDLTTQYWTSRGFAVIDVNYGGSSGYGREYRDRLRMNWGVVDNQDAASAAQYLIERGDVDPRRIAITGMSAGGYATICSVTFHDIFAAGSAHFGIGDMEAMAGLFHKFQSRFLNSMIAPFPEGRDEYKKRSAINFVEQIKCPILLFHGALDSIVPISQSELLFEKLERLQKAAAIVTFADEPHVFRKAENIKLTMETELSFYGLVFGFSPADTLRPADISKIRQCLEQREKVPQAGS